MKTKISILAIVLVTLFACTKKPLDGKDGANGSNGSNGSSPNTTIVKGIKINIYKSSKGIYVDTVKIPAITSSVLTTGEVTALIQCASPSSSLFDTTGWSQFPLWVSSVSTTNAPPDEITYELINGGILVKSNYSTNSSTLFNVRVTVNK